ncbi:hypothetical protein BSKO_10065 [Bryopsis sp. KO-2023]|nr:hypothetical protein BSKO_10065 [Bryopsis sp. KO-2023]
MEAAPAGQSLQAIAEDDKQFKYHILNPFRRRRKKDPDNEATDFRQDDSVVPRDSRKSTETMSDSVSSNSEEEEDDFSENIELGSDLYIQVINARGVLAMDASGTSDPYCTVFVGSSSRRTSSIKKTLNPDWNETFVFHTDDVQHSRGRIKFQVWDADDWSKDDFLGQAKVDLRQIMNNEGSEVTIELKRSRNIFKHIGQISIAPLDRGTITVALHWRPSARSSVAPSLSLLPCGGSGMKSICERCVSSLCTTEKKTLPAVIHTSAGSLYEEPGIVYLCMQVSKVRIEPKDGGSSKSSTCAIQTTINKVIETATGRAPFSLGLINRRRSKSKSEIPAVGSTKSEPIITKYQSINAPRSDFLDMWAADLDSVDGAEWGSFDARKSLDGGGHFGSDRMKRGLDRTMDQEDVVQSCMIDGRINADPHWYYRVEFLRQKHSSGIVSKEAEGNDIEIPFACQSAFVAALPVRNKEMEIKLYNFSGDKSKAKLMMKWRLALFDLLDGVQTIWTTEDADGLKGTMHASCKLIHADARASLYNMKWRESRKAHGSTGSTSSELSVDNIRGDSVSEAERSLQNRELPEAPTPQDPLPSPQASMSESIQPYIGHFCILIDSLELVNPVDCFCVMKFGPHWCKTIEHVAADLYTWKWEIKLPIYDPATMLSFSVFQETRSKIVTVGKLRMRISTLGPNQPYRSNLPIRAGGSVTGKVKMTMRVVYPSAYLVSMHYLKPMMPKDLYMFHLDSDETIKQESRALILRWLDGSSPRVPNIVARRVLDLEKESFSTKRLRVHIQRIKLCFAPLMPSSKKLVSLQNWENTVESAAVCMAMCFAIYFPNLTIFLALMALMIFASYIYRIPDSPPAMDDLLLIQEAQDDQPDTEPHVKTKDPLNPYLLLKRKYDKIQVILVRVQDLLDTLASFFEKLQALFTWRDPVATKMFTAGLLIVAVAVHVCGIQFFMCCGALWFMRPPSMRDPLPAPPFSFFDRLPSRSDQVL